MNLQTLCRAHDYQMTLSHVNIASLWLTMLDNRTDEMATNGFIQEISGLWNLRSIVLKIGRCGVAMAPGQASGQSAKPLSVSVEKPEGLTP